MRVNMPVTNVEKRLQEGDVIVSKTDAKGLITYINKTFCEISGFTEEELIGAPQNIVRHPDMPAAAFKDLWDTIQAGKSWKGLVKNRCKNGDHYWVEANANPIWENGRISGYMSLRTRASREQIEFAENLYRKVREGKARGWKIKEGRALRTGLFGIWNSICKPTVTLRMSSLVGFLSLIAIGFGISGVVGMGIITDSLGDVYNRNTVPTAQIAEIQKFLLRNRLRLESSLVTPADIPKNTGEVEQNIAKITEIWGKYMAGDMSEQRRQAAQKFAEHRKYFVQDGLKPAIELLRSHKMEAASKHIEGTVRALFQPVDEDINALIKMQIDSAKQRFDTASNEAVLMRNIAIGAITVAIGFAVYIAWLLMRSILRPLKEIEMISMAISSGDLTSRIDVKSDDEIGRVQQAVKNVNGNIRGIVRDVRLGSHNISQASKEVAAGSDNLSQRTQEQASALEETASSMEEMTSTVKQNADNARQANQLAVGARDQAAKGGEVMTKAVGSMNEISSASKKIADIISVIDEIAFQTNLLALNAAVEAARAGEQGRGFAVVASEVRNLAQRSAGAAKEIKELISDSVEKVKTGSALVDQSGGTLLNIVDGVKKVTDIVAEIAAASQEQSTGIEQVNKAVMQMDEVTQQNAALVEESSAASRSMEAQGQKLVELMGFFRLGDEGDQVRTTQTSGKPRKQESRLAQLRREKGLPTPAEMRKAAG